MGRHPEIYGFVLINKAVVVADYLGEHARNIEMKVVTLNPVHIDSGSIFSTPFEHIVILLSLMSHHQSV